MILREPNLTVRLGGWLSASLILSMLLCACSRMRTGEAGEAKPPPFEVRLELNKSAYRPGELVQCRVKIVSLLDDDLLVAPLQPRESRNQANLNFYMGEWGELSDVVLRRVPVQLNPPGQRLEPVEILARGEMDSKHCKFSFVNLTEEPGEFKLQAHYTTSLTMTHQDHKTIVSKPVKYSVKGKRLFARDGNGLIVEEDAIRAALKAYGKLSRETRAILVTDEKSGLRKWWVTIEKMPYDAGANENPRVAYYVSPYGGQVQPAQTAFDWKAKAETQAGPVPKRNRTAPDANAAKEGRPAAGGAQSGALAPRTAR